MRGERIEDRRQAIDREEQERSMTDEAICKIRMLQNEVMLSRQGPKCLVEFSTKSSRNF